MLYTWLLAEALMLVTPPRGPTVDADPDPSSWRAPPSSCPDHEVASPLLCSFFWIGGVNPYLFSTCWYVYMFAILISVTLMEV
jgi:hypothetical protein